MTAIQETLKRHETGWSSDRISYSRDKPFYYFQIPGTGLKYKISIINAGLYERPDWYYKIYLNDKHVCTNHHFLTPEEALEAAYGWSEDTGLTLRKPSVNHYGDKNTFTVDGLLDADVNILEFNPGEFRRQWIEPGKNWLWSQMSWATAEDAFEDFTATYRSAS